MTPGGQSQHWVPGPCCSSPVQKNRYRIVISIETVPNRLLKQSSLIEPYRTTKYQDIMQQTKMPLPLGQRLCIRPLTPPPPSHHVLDCEVYGIRTNAPMHAITIAATMCGLYIGATHIKCVLLRQFVLLELEVTRQPNIRLANHSSHS